MTDSIDFRQEFENDTFVSYPEDISENISDFENSTEVPSACGKLDKDYMRIWGAFQWWLEGIGFTGLGIAGKSSVGVKIRNLKVDFKTGGTWRRVRQ